MESLEISAKTVEEAIQRALKELGVSREEVEVVVLKEGKAGVLGLGAEEAKVKVTPLVPTDEGEGDVVEIAKGVLEKLLAAMGVTASVVIRDQPVTEGAPPVSLDVMGEDLGILIGRRGQTLSCLQYIVRLIVSHQTKIQTPITIDVEGYRQRRYESLRALAQRIAEKVKIKRMPFTLEPMSAYERRIIHLALADHPDVTTHSTGVDEARRVVVVPREQ